MATDQLAAFVAAFVYVFVIVDPLASLPVFMSLTEKMDESRMKKAARDAVIIAGAIAIVFIFTGAFVLEIMKIDMASFRIAGGIVLGLLGLETVLGLSFGNSKESGGDGSAIATLIATPLLTGPGLITALILMQEESGYLVPIAATVSALFVSWLVLDRAGMIRRMIGHQTIEVLAKVIGLFLVAIGVSFIKAGLGI